MGDFRKKCPAVLFREEKKHVSKFLGKKNPALKKISLMTYNAEKKSYTVISREKNF